MWRKIDNISVFFRKITPGVFILNQKEKILSTTFRDLNSAMIYSTDFSLVLSPDGKVVIPAPFYLILKGIIIFWIYV